VLCSVQVHIYPCPEESAKVQGARWHYGVEREPQWQPYELRKQHYMIKPPLGNSEKFEAEWGGRH